jgi:clan AA aspartic protease
VIEGAVNVSREAVVPLTVTGPAGRTQPIDAVIDTGFNGFLTLPSALVSELQLPFVTRGRATLANGSEDVFGIHNAVVMWDGQPRRVLTDVADTAPLAGMSLLDGHSLYVEVEEGGRVAIQAGLPQPPIDTKPPNSA